MPRIRRIKAHFRKPSGLTPELERLARDAGIPIKTVRVKHHKRRAGGGRPRKDGTPVRASVTKRFRKPHAKSIDNRKEG